MSCGAPLLAAALLLLAPGPSPSAASKHLFLGDTEQLEVDPDKRTAVLLADFEPRILLDYAVGIKAYKDPAVGRCYVERLDGSAVEKPDTESRRRQFVVGQNFTKYELLRVAGLQVVNFCQGTQIHVYSHNSPQSNDNHLTSNSIIEESFEPIRPRRRKRHFESDEIFVEEFQDTTHDKQLLSKVNQKENDIGYKQSVLQGRRKRQTNGQPPRRRYNGQTQTQYVAFNKEGSGEKSGTAEAVAQPDLSRATVSGTNGMGQAQSQSGSGGCEDCFPGGFNAYGSQDVQSGRTLHYPVGPDGRFGGRPGVPGISIPGAASPSARPGEVGSYPGAYPAPGVQGLRPGDSGLGTLGSRPGVGVPGVQTTVQGGVAGTYPEAEPPGGYPLVRGPDIGKPGVSGSTTGLGVTGFPSGAPATFGTYPAAPGSGVQGVGTQGFRIPGTYTETTGVGAYPGSQGARDPGSYPGLQGVGAPTAYPGQQSTGTQSGGVAGAHPGSQVTGTPGVYLGSTPGVGSQSAKEPDIYPGLQGSRTPLGVYTRPQGVGSPGGYPGSQGVGAQGAYPQPQGVGGVPGGYPGSQGAAAPGAYPGTIGVGAPGPYPVSQGAPSGYPGLQGVGVVPGGYPGSQGIVTPGGYPGSQGIGAPGTYSGPRGATEPGVYPEARDPDTYPGSSKVGTPGGYPGSQGIGAPGVYPGAQGVVGPGGFPGSQGAGVPGAYPGSQGVVGSPGAYSGLHGAGRPGEHPGLQSVGGAPGGYPGFPGSYPGSSGALGGYPGVQGTGVTGAHPGQGARVHGAYPGSQGVVGSGEYPGTQGAGVLGAYPGSQGVVGSSGYPGSQGAGVPGVFPGSQGVVGPGGYPGSQGAGVPGLYPGSQGAGVPGAYPGSQGVVGSGEYPGSQGSGVPGAYPGSQGVVGSGGYPGSQGVGAPGAYPGSQGVVASSGYPGSQTAGVPGAYPGSQGVIGSGRYPGSQGVGVLGAYPGSQGGATPGSYPGSPGIRGPESGVYPGSLPIGGQGAYPGTPGYSVGAGGSGVSRFDTSSPGSRVPGAEVPGVGGAASPGVRGPGEGTPGSYPGLPGAYPVISGAGTVGPGRVGTAESGTGSLGGKPPGTYTGVGTPGVPGEPSTGTLGSYPGRTEAGAYPPHVIPGFGIPGTYPGVLGVGTPGVPSGLYGPGAVPQGGKTPGSYPAVQGSFPGVAGTGTIGTGAQGITPGYSPGVLGLHPSTDGRIPSGTGGSGSVSSGGTSVYSAPGVGYPTVGGPGVGVTYPVGYPGAPSSTSVGPGYGTGVGGGTALGTGPAIQGFGAPSGLSGGDAQAQTSVQYQGKETKLAASSQGKIGDGTAQTQVSGTYSGSGVFSAQAQTSDKDKGAQSQIDGGDRGATSNAQGRAGSSQAQAQVQMGSENGATIAESQSSGLNFGTNTQVQAGTKGGLADAQSKGQGSTQSQAQIGFTPYQKGVSPEQESVFRGGGSASSQSSAVSGQSQTQIQGSFKYGVSYLGAAQAGSGVTGTVFPKLNLTNDFTIYNFSNPSSRSGPVSSDPNENVGLTGESRPLDPSPDPLLSLPSGRLEDTNKQAGNTQNYHPQNEGIQRRENKPFNQNSGSLGQASSSQNTADKVDEDEEDYEEEYEDEDELQLSPGQVSSRSGSHTTPKPTTVAPTLPPSQTQHVILGTNVPHGAKVIRDSVQAGDVFQPGEQIPGAGGYTVPSGFRGKVKSVAGDTTEASASGGGQAQTQTVLLTPGSGNITYIDKSKSKQELLGRESYYNRRHSQPVPQSHYRTGDYMNRYGTRSLTRNDQHLPLNKNYDSFVTVSNSETGEINGDKIEPKKKVTHTYYTKSSTCGYFTFTCNAIHGSNGRTKICKPNPPTYADGTPCGS